MKLCTQCGTRFSEPVAFCPHDGSPTQELDQEPPPDPLIGRVIDGRYRVEKQIGEGGMGVVYAIKHAVLGKRMALKVLRGDMAKDADVVQRFMQEAQSATSIGHPNIIDISDFGRLPDGSVYFVMEFLDGQSLTHFIGTGGSVPLQTAFHIVRQIASALEAAHARGIVHRDMKPDNIYLVKQGHDPYFVKVLDFGIAKVGGASSKLTKTGMIFGTPHYMSPEQASGQSVDRRTDLYALGVIMYEMFTGTVPFDGDTFMGILSKHMFEPPLPPSQVKGSRLGAIEGVILKALAKKPDERYGAMSELIADIDAISTGGSIDISRRGAIAPPGNLADSLEPPSRTEMRLGQQFGAAGMPPEPDAPTKSRVPMVLAMLVVLAIIGVGVGGTVFWMTGSPATASSGGPAPIVVPPLPETSAPTTTTTPIATTITPTAPIVPTAALTGTPQPVAPIVAPQRTIEVVSEPAGAEVVIDGVIVGNTPVQLPAPREGERVAELRMRGYEPSSVMIGTDSPTSMRVTLAAVQTASTSRTSSRRRPETTEVTPPTTTPTAVPTTTRTRPSSEVVDPWAQ